MFPPKPLDTLPLEVEDLDAFRCFLTGPHAFGPKNIYFVPKILMNSHTTVATSQWEGGQMELY